jgi:hypothetical protein
LGYSTPFRVALAAYLNAGLAGYVVNIVGPAFGTAICLRRHGVSPGHAVLLTLLANALGFCGILVWAPVGLLLLSRNGMADALPILGHHGPQAAVVILAALGLAMLVVIRTLATTAGSTSRLAHLLLARERTTEYGGPPALRSRQVLALVPYSALSWVVGVGALYVVVTAMSHGVTVTLGAVVGSAVLAAALGSLAFFAPEGVGLKDGALVALLSHATSLPLTTCIVAALAVRALDPVTKLGLLGVLGLIANKLVARFFVGATASLRRVALRPRMPLGLALLGRRTPALLSASILIPVLALSGHSSAAHTDNDLTSACVTAQPKFVSIASTDLPADTRSCLGGIGVRGSAAPTIVWSAPRLGMTNRSQSQSGSA